MTRWYVPHAFSLEAKIIPAQLILSNETLLNLRFLTAKGIPYEVGGLIHDDGQVCQYANTFYGDKCHGFDMEVDIADTIFAVWHSHPTGPEQLSKDDVLAMMELHDHGFTWPWIVVGPTTITRWIVDKTPSAI